MKIEDAYKLDSDLKEYLKIYSLKLGLDPIKSEEIVEDFIEIVPDRQRKDFILINKECYSSSYKKENIIIDLKKFMYSSLVEITALDIPSSKFDFIKLLLATIIYIKEISEIRFNQLDTYIICVLHLRNAYEYAIEENNFILYLQELYSREKCKVIERDDIEKSLMNLMNTNVIDITDGNILLREKILFFR
ncbi:hypothetical protein [Intestinibacter sp.]